ncbi:uncharacterized protein CTRU02_204052 [Colletotrichum truncatum]|uniref:Uncharacterized protein n=1 Tax=Colletotrichum truncatum TaxID=5467 RepID=A0ACC3ZB19_COLTU|nr:uncharacterized protein CTRU02_13647 [Colletotrichum truncatum]KAF6783180.1 hypothetical protein CTRU02_13647 [Colletotrichum truncatum]
MQLSGHLIAAISAISFAAPGIAAPGPGQVGEWWNISCKHGGPNNIVTGDISGLIHSLRTQSVIGNVGTPVWITSNSDVKFWYGTTLVTVLNKYLLEGANFEFRHLADALEAMRNSCCGSYPNCIASSANMRSSNYKNLVILVSRN